MRARRRQPMPRLFVKGADAARALGLTRRPVRAALDAAGVGYATLGHGPRPMVLVPISELARLRGGERARAGPLAPS